MNTPDPWWERGFAKLEAYVARRGTAAVKPSYGVDRDEVKELIRWCDGQRLRFRGGSQTAEQIAALEALPGWDWGLVDESWDLGIAHLRQYGVEHGNVDVPRQHVCADGYRLGAWTVRMRQERGWKRLAPERVAELEEFLGWSWHSPSADPLSGAWVSGLDRLEQFLDHRGHADVPEDFVCDDGFELGRWVGKRRADYSASRLDSARAAELETFPGWTWKRPFKPSGITIEGL